MSDTYIIDNDGEVYDDMHNIEIEPSDEDVQCTVFQDIESVRQSGCGCSLLHGKNKHIFKFRGFDNFIQNVVQSGLSKYVQNKLY